MAILKKDNKLIEDGEVIGEIDGDVVLTDRELTEDEKETLLMCLPDTEEGYEFLAEKPKVTLPKKKAAKKRVAKPVKAEEPVKTDEPVPDKNYGISHPDYVVALHNHDFEKFCEVYGVVGEEKRDVDEMVKDPNNVYPGNRNSILTTKHRRHLY